jgi:hypothetical protein
MGKLEKLQAASATDRQARVDLLYYLERACRMILADTPKYAGAHFAALKRILDREEPGYAR